MRIKLAGLVVAVVGLVATAPAYAQTEFTVSATGSKKAGSATKPKPFNGTFFYGAAGPEGSRAATPDSWGWSWEGVKYNGNKFPTCTTTEIDLAQSDSVCPAKSLVAEAAVAGELGPEADPFTSATCLGKTIRMYNAGKKAMTVIVVGPGDQCAGVGYLPPFEAPITTEKAKVASASKKGKNKKASTSTVTYPWPDNLTHPLPGVSGGLNTMDTTYIQRKKGKGKKKVSYMESTGCKGTREFTFTTVDTEGTHVDVADAGTCK